MCAAAVSPWDAFLSKCDAIVVESDSDYISNREMSTMLEDTFQPQQEIAVFAWCLKLYNTINSFNQIWHVQAYWSYPGHALIYFICIFSRFCHLFLFLLTLTSCFLLLLTLFCLQLNHRTITKGKHQISCVILWLRTSLRTTRGTYMHVLIWLHVNF